jgi:uncharacterized protein YndB with AHSA1/START domain
LEELAGTVHIEKTIKAPVTRVYRAFQQTRTLKIWYDPRCRIDKFSVGGKLVGDNYPSAEIVALVQNHTIVYRYSDIVSGLSIWSFAEKAGGKATLLFLDHIDASENAEERDSITFYWRGLVENLAAFCEGRKTPFDHDAGDYKQGMEPRVPNPERRA